MDPNLIPAMSGVLGSLVGGSATVATAWLTQKTLTRRELNVRDMRQRDRERSREHTQMADWDAGSGGVRHGSERMGTVAASRQRSVDVLSGFRPKVRRGSTCGRVST